MEVTTLPSGLRVASEHMEGVRSVSVGFWVDAGARDERRDQRGLAHFIEHMLFKGGARHDATAIAELFDELGAELNAATAKDSTLVYARVLDDHLPVALDVMTDMLRSPSWSELEQEREVVLEEIAMVEDQPQEGVHDLATLAMFGDDDPLGHPILGDPGVIGTAEVASVAEFHRAAYADPSIVLAAAGNVDHDALCELAGTLMAASPGPGELLHRPSSGGRLPGRRFQQKDTEQFHVCICGPGLARADDDRSVLSLLDVMLGGTASSRLFQEIRERRGMAYSVYSYHSAYAECGQTGSTSARAPRTSRSASRSYARRRPRWRPATCARASSSARSATSRAGCCSRSSRRRRGCRGSARTCSRAPRSSSPTRSRAASRRSRPSRSPSSPRGCGPRGALRGGHRAGRGRLRRAVAEACPTLQPAA